MSSPVIPARCPGVSLIATLVLVLTGAAVQAQSSGYLYSDLGPIGGTFVGPLPPSRSAPSVAQAFLAQGGVSSFIYGGAGIGDLGNFGGDSAGTYFANASGQVAAESAGSTPGVNRAFLASGGSVSDLGTLGGTGTYIAGINAAGQVAGYSDTAGNVSTHAYLYSSGTLNDLGTLGGSYSAARGLNNAGAVVGDAYLTGDTGSHAFLYSAGAMRDLGTLGGSSSFASAINNAGQVIGNSYLLGNSASHAFFYSSGRMIDVGTLGGTTSSAVALNAAGQVIGNAALGGDAATHAFLYSAGRLNDLGTLGGSNSFALGINSLGQIIGLSDIAGNRAQHAFLYSGGRMFDLDSPFAGVSGFVAAGINDAMQIIGRGMTAVGLQRGFIISAVPGPPGGLSMLFGMAAVAALARRRTGKRRLVDASSPGSTRVRVDVLGVPIDVLDQAGVVDRLVAWAQECRGRTVCACNVHSVVQSRSDPALAAAIRHADLALADGAPVAWRLRRAGHRSQRRVCGPDLMWSYFAAAAARGQRVFLYGSTEATLAALIERAARAFPDLVIAGSHAPAFHKGVFDEDAAVIERINASGAGTVWVSLGCPKQEAWMEAHRYRINAVMVGVGAGFDFHAGVIRRAPAWIRAIGFEWLHRFASEPRRLARRYLVTNSVFVGLTLRDVLLGAFTDAAQPRSLAGRSRLGTPQAAVHG